MFLKIHSLIEKTIHNRAEDFFLMFFFQGEKKQIEETLSIFLNVTSAFIVMHNSKSVYIRSSIYIDLASPTYVIRKK